MNKLRLTLFASLLLFSCEDGVKDSSDSSLELNMKKWQSQNFSSYRMNLDVSCFCIPAPNIEIRVNNEKISLINGENFTDDDLQNKFWHARTVEDLFEFIEDNLSRDPHEKKLKYNETFGYPEKVYFDIDEMTADDEEAWDSLSHIGLIMETEKYFGIRIKNSEVARLANVGDLINLVEKKQQG